MTEVGVSARAVEDDVQEPVLGAGVGELLRHGLADLEDRSATVLLLGQRANERGGVGKSTLSILLWIRQRFTREL